MTITVTTGQPIATSIASNAKDYAWLVAAVSNWMARSDLTGDVADIIQLGESALNRELGPVEIDTTLTGTVGSRAISVSSLSIVKPIAVFLVDTSSSDEVGLTQKTDGTFPYLSTSSRPVYWTMDTVGGGDNIEFDCPLDTAYTFRFRYQERFTLSSSITQNWLLINHPDLYLAAVLLWGGLFTRDSDFYGAYSNILATGIPGVKSIIAQRKRAVASVDAALVQRNTYYNGVLA